MRAFGMRAVNAFVLAGLLVSACGVPQPSNTEVAPPENSTRAYTLVVAAWAARTTPNPLVGELPPVRWFAGPCLDYGDSGEGCTIGGWSFASVGGDSEIHLVLMETIPESSLAHEVLHWVLQDDPNHEHDLWLEVPDVNAMLVSEGF